MKSLAAINMFRKILSKVYIAWYYEKTRHWKASSVYGGLPVFQKKKPNLISSFCFFPTVCLLSFQIVQIIYQTIIRLN